MAFNQQQATINSLREKRDHKKGKAKDDKERKRGGKGRGRRLLRLGIVLAIIVAAAVALRVYVVQPYYIPSASMEPTLHGCPGCNDDHILINKLADTSGPPAEQDIIVFKRPPSVASTDSVLVKRVVGLPGDTVQLKKGLVYINGLAISVNGPRAWELDLAIDVVVAGDSYRLTLRNGVLVHRRVGGEYSRAAAQIAVDTAFRLVTLTLGDAVSPGFEVSGTFR